MTIGLLVVLLVQAVGTAMVARAEGVASEWVVGHNVRTRLMIGVGDSNLGAVNSDGQMLAGVEMELADGWKTYWRTPGDAGGVPPEFDWSGSTNVAQPTVLYPAPQRMTDRAGSTIGYKKHVVFPVHIKPEKPGQPVTLKLQLAFGVCREICVPSEARYEVTVPAGAKPPLPAQVAVALSRVPSDAGARAEGRGIQTSAPKLAKVEASLDGAAPKLIMHVTFPKGVAGADVFVEGPPGEFVPLPVKTGEAGANTLIYEIDLSKGADVAALKGKELVATIVSDAAHGEQRFILK